MNRWIISAIFISLLWTVDHVKLHSEIGDLRGKANTDTIYIERDEKELTKENLLREIKRLKIKEPEIVFNQAMLETGHLNCSDCSLSKNNLWGFADESYLVFEDWRQCVAYYYGWQKRKYGGGDYYEFLRKRWGCENPEGYVAELRVMR